jgi:hypothetical protein
MDLLFDKDNNGDKELKELLGFINADFKFKNMKSDIITATNDIIGIIGQETYATAVTAYKKTDPTADDKDLYYAIRYPIAVEGYRRYAPSNDLLHTQSGRKNISETHEKAPFEWQIDRDNKSLERRFYRGLDDMIIYLDVESEVWKESDNYKETIKLFIRTTKQFDDIFPIGNSRFLFLKLLPGIKKTQEYDILPRIGQETYWNILKKLSGEELPDFTINQNLLLKIKEAIAYKSMAWALPRYSAQLFPEGTLQSYTPDRVTTQSKQVPVKSEVPSIVQLLNQDADLAFAKIETIIAADKSVDPVEISKLTPYYDPNDPFLTT